MYYQSEIDLLKSLCKHGLPKGNVYEFSAQSVLKFERKIKKAQASMKTSRVEPQGHEKVARKEKSQEAKELKELKEKSVSKEKVSTKKGTIKK